MQQLPNTDFTIDPKYKQISLRLHGTMDGPESDFTYYDNGLITLHTGNTWDGWSVYGVRSPKAVEMIKDIVATLQKHNGETEPQATVQQIKTNTLAFLTELSKDMKAEEQTRKFSPAEENRLILAKQKIIGDLLMSSIPK